MSKPKMKKIRGVERCPSCNTSLRGESIPREDQQFFGGAKYFGRKIALYNIEADKTYAYMCPDCKYVWDR